MILTSFPQTAYRVQTWMHRNSEFPITMHRIVVRTSLVSVFHLTLVEATEDLRAVTSKSCHLLQEAPLLVAAHVQNTIL